MRRNDRPAWQQTLIRVAPLLLVCTAAAGAQLRDAGYGDGSLVDAHGNYYYPQPDGGYLDAYGAAYSPLGSGLFGDALGKLIDVGANPDATDPLARPPSAVGAPDRRRGAQPPPTGGRHRAPLDRDPRSAPVEAAPPETATGDQPSTDEAGADAPSDFGPRYLDDVGDGYYRIDPHEIAADPRLAQPVAGPAAAGAPADAPPLQEPDLADPEPEATPGAQFGPDPDRVELSPAAAEKAGPQGAVRAPARRLRPTD